MGVGKGCEGERVRGRVYGSIISPTGQMTSTNPLTIFTILSLTLTVRVFEEQRHGNRNHDVTTLCSDPVVHLSGKGE